MGKQEFTSIEGTGYGNVKEPTKIKKGIKVIIYDNNFCIDTKNIKNINLKYLPSLTKTLMRICKELEKEGRLTNLFGKPIKWN